MLEFSVLIDIQEGKADIKDDRPAEDVSYAATNLVKPGLQSKRLQSEPPLGRGTFPPTPPPEPEKAAAPASMSRGASVRNGTRPIPAKLNMDKARGNQSFEVREERPRQQTRATSESRGPARGYQRESPRRTTPQRREPSRNQRRPTDDEEDEYPDELYDMYRNSRSSKSGSGKSRQQSRYDEPDDDYASEYDDGSFDEGEFEMISSRPPPRSRASSNRGGSRRPDIRKIRVKVHAEDNRYIMIGTAIEFVDLVDRIREKFGLRKRFKIKMRDEDMPNGDMITMGDQDDLEMAIMYVKANAKKERLDMGKLDVSFLIPHSVPTFVNVLVALDSGDMSTKMNNVNHGSIFFLLSE